MTKFYNKKIKLLPREVKNFILSFFEFRNSQIHKFLNSYIPKLTTRNVQKLYWTQPSYEHLLFS
ncbi:MAG: hypothetical protein UR51_C0004G0058 [Candidatus Moranbacteria bacterium GW2011_GWF1_34_10]|nr:MAG: hypothetical protein UR51_C0004G0058 [Candidatus Moranbacteria bacterium GW2011_GWF1_34_10]